MMKLITVLLSAAATLAALQHRGVDWSSVAVEERAGIQYRASSSAQPQPLERILASSGVTTVRQRVWTVGGSSADYGLDYNVALARRAKAAGLALYIDLHLSDTWADPGHQAIPSGWPSDIDGLAWRLYNYTLAVSNRLASEGLSPAIVSIGNEITAGLLFPTGSTKNMYNVARLLHSAAYGIKDSGLAPKPRIMIHTDKGWDWPTQQWFYSTLLAQGPLAASDFDMMGVSYYPFYNSAATLASLRTSLANMASTWGKDIVVAETDWPTSCPSPAHAFPSDLKGIPFSAAGQTQFVQQVAAVVAGVRNGKGLFYWEPAWVDNAALGSSCPSNTMFQYPGTALSSLAVFKTI